MKKPKKMSCDEERKMWKRSFLQEQKKILLLREAIYALRMVDEACDSVKVSMVE